MVWVKVCRVSLELFSSFSDGRPTDKILEKKAPKEKSPPSQGHAFIEIYTCKGCFDGIANCEIQHGDNIKTEVLSPGVSTTILYTTNMAAEDQILHTFESLKTMDDIKRHLSKVAKDHAQYNLYNNNCICFVNKICEFLGQEIPDTKLHELQVFMEKLSKKTGWIKLSLRWSLTIGCLLLLCYWTLQRFS